MRRTLSTYFLFLVCLLVAAPAWAASSRNARSLDDQLADVARKAPGFAGMFYREGKLFVCMKQRSDKASRSRTQLLRAAAEKEAAERAITEVFGQGRVPGEGTETCRCEYDFLQLSRWREGANALLNDSDVIATDIDEEKNRVRIDVQSSEAQARVEAALARQGVPPSALEVVVTDAFHPYIGLRDVVRPVVGGVQIRFRRGASGFLCTMGFFAAYGDKYPGFVTNSHCTENRGTTDYNLYWQPTLPDDNYIGFEGWDPEFFTGSPCPVGRVCRYSDAAWAYLEASGTLGEIARTAGIGSLEIVGAYRIVAKRQGLVGETLHKVGRTSGLQTGTQVQTCINANVVGGNITMLCQDRISPDIAVAGDSGSPVFVITDTPQEGDVDLVGILWGGNGTTSVYSPLYLVEAELGALRICDPTAGCPDEP